MTEATFPEAKVESLILAVQKFEHLYNSQLNEHHVRSYASNAWKIVSAEVGETVPDCRKKWKGLRTTFLRNKSEMSGRSGDGAKDTPKWEWYNLLKFLTPFVKRRRTITNAVIPVPTPTPTVDETIDEDNIDVEELDQSDFDEGTAKTPEVVKSKKKCKNPPQQVPQDDTLLKRTLVESLVSEANDNSDTVFGRYVAKTLAELSETSKITAKMQISQILGNCQLADRQPQYPSYNQSFPSSSAPQFHQPYHQPPYVSPGKSPKKFRKSPGKSPKNRNAATSLINFYDPYAYDPNNE